MAVTIVCGHERSTGVTEMKNRHRGMMLAAGLAAGCSGNSLVETETGPSSAIVIGRVANGSSPVIGATVRTVALIDSTCVKQIPFSDTSRTLTDSQGNYRAVLTGPTVRQEVCIKVLVDPAAGSGLLPTTVSTPRAVHVDVRKPADSVRVNVQY
jgi:hypothetical protein